MTTKRSAKKEINKEIESKENVKDIKAPEGNKLAGLVLYGEEEFLFWTPSEYREVYPEDRSKWPVFKIRSYNAEDESAIIELMISENVDSKNATMFFVSDPRTTRLIVKRCLVGVKNLRDVNDKEVKLETEDGLVSDKFISRLPFKLKNELKKVIMGSTEVTEEESASLKF